MTMDVLSAYPHAKDNQEVHVRIPNEFEEAVIGCENLMNGFYQQELENDLLVLRLGANVCGRKPAGANWRAFRTDLINLA